MEDGSFSLPYDPRVRRRTVLKGAVLLTAARVLPAYAEELPRAQVDVAVDPGHSWADVGATGGGLAEYEVTLDLAQRLRAELEGTGLSVRLTREDHAPLTSMLHPDSTERIALEQTARIEAGMPARVYVSLHFNGGPPSLRGTETYYNPERAEGGSDWLLASLIQHEVLRGLRDYGYESVDRGARSDLTAGKPYGHFFSLRGPVPSALLESLFLSNPTEAALASDPAVLDALASGCAQGIREYLASALD